MILCRGDITKRDEIAWGYTTNDAAPFLKYLTRDLLFREAVLGFLGVKDGNSERDEYCRLCKKKNPDIDCSECSGTIGAIHADKQ